MSMVRYLLRLVPSFPSALHNSPETHPSYGVCQESVSIAGEDMGNLNHALLVGMQNSTVTLGTAW